MFVSNYYFLRQGAPTAQKNSICATGPDWKRAVEPQNKLHFFNPPRKLVSLASEFQHKKHFLEVPLQSQIQVIGISYYLLDQVLIHTAGSRFTETGLIHNRIKNDIGEIKSKTFSRGLQPQNYLYKLAPLINIVLPGNRSQYILQSGRYQILCSESSYFHAFSHILDAAKYFAVGVEIMCL